jgi:hypothetical protein
MCAILEGYVGMTAACKLAGRTEQWMRHLFDSHQLRGVRDPSGRRWFLRRDLEQYVADRQQKQDAAQPDLARNDPVTATNR